MATTIVNTPPGQSSGDSGMGFVVGIVILVVLGILFYFYGLPYLRQTSTQDIQVNVPPADINVPSEIDVTIETPE